MPPKPPKSPGAMLALWRRYANAAQSLKDRAAARCEVLREVDKYTRDGMPLMEARKLVSGQCRSQSKSGVSPSSIARWQADVEGHHPSDWLPLLIPHYQGRRTFAEIEPDMWMRFKTDFLRAECPSAASCYERLSRTAESRGRPLPSLKTLMRRMDEELPTWRQARRSSPRLRQMDLFG